MELKLKTKNKVYTAETFDVSFGVIDDTIKALNPETVDFEDKLALGKAIMGAWKQVEPILMDLFDGVTHDELRTVKMSNLVGIVKKLYVYMKEELSDIGNDSGDDEKN